MHRPLAIGIFGIGLLMACASGTSTGTEDLGNGSTGGSGATSASSGGGESSGSSSGSSSGGSQANSYSGGGSDHSPQHPPRWRSAQGNSRPGAYDSLAPE